MVVTSFKSEPEPLTPFDLSSSYVANKLQIYHNVNEAIDASSR